MWETHEIHMMVMTRPGKQRQSWHGASFVTCSEHSARRFLETCVGARTNKDVVITYYSTETICSSTKQDKTLRDYSRQWRYPRPMHRFGYRGLF